MEKKILLVIALFILPINILGLTYGGCDYSSVSRLKSLVTNINISYSYRIENNNAYFDITLNNITPEMYFYDVANKKNYYYADTNNGEITIHNYIGNGKTGTYKFYSAKKECYGISLGSKYYKLPNYNIYYGSELCKSASNYNLCQKWATVNYSYEELESLIYEYKNKNNKQNIIDNSYKKGFLSKLVDFYINYYYYLLIGIIVIFGVIIIVKKRKDKLEL